MSLSLQERHPLPSGVSGRKSSGGLVCGGGGWFTTSAGLEPDDIPGRTVFSPAPWPGTAEEVMSASYHGDGCGSAMHGHLPSNREHRCPSSALRAGCELTARKHEPELSSTLH